MRKTNKKLYVWLLAGVLTAGVPAGWRGFPVQVQAAEEETEKENKEENKVTGTVRPSDYVLAVQDSYSYGDMGLSFVLPKELLKRMEDKEVAMLPDAEITEDGTGLKYGLLSWSTMTQEQRDAEVDREGNGYTEWKKSLGRIGTLGVYHKDLEKDLDKLTGCTEHEELGASEDGEYIYYLSTNDEADKNLTAELKEIETEITQMVSYGSSDMKEGESLGSFTTEDINGEKYTEEIFKEAELTMVNVFATWCSPCVNEIPYLAELDEKMADKGVQVVGVVMDAMDGTEKSEEGIKKAQALAKKTKAEYPFLLPDSGYMNGRLSNIQAFPETFFVDKNGTIVGETYSGSRSLEEWEEIVNKELEGMKAE